MRRIDVEKKRRSRWPWVIAIIALGLAIWGITELLAPPEEPAGPEAIQSPADTLPPVAIPAGDADGGDGVQPLSALMPLGPDDEGREVRFSGPVVATTNSGYWVAADSVIVAVRTDRPASTGDSVDIQGTFREVEENRGVRAAQVALAEHPLYRDWPILVPIQVVPGDAAADTAPADTGGG